MTEISGQYLEVIIPTALQSYNTETNSEDWSDSYLELLELKDQIHSLQTTVEELRDLLLASNGSSKKTSDLSRRLTCSTPGCIRTTRSKSGLCKACRDEEKFLSRGLT
jgi:hypothetical protein